MNNLKRDPKVFGWIIVVFVIILLVELFFGCSVYGQNSIGDKAVKKYNNAIYTLPDTVEINQIGFVIYQHYPVIVDEKDSIAVWDIMVKLDTLWFDENEPIALPGDYERILYRKIKKVNYH